MSVLVTGGAGYIGSHTVSQLVKNDEDVIILDNLEKGHKQSITNGKFYLGDIRNTKILDEIFTENDIDSVIHFAAYSLVGESVLNPLKYYENNVYGSTILIKKMIEYGVKKIVFSSTAAIYGEPESIPIKEESRLNPTNPYGESKLAIERLLKWSDAAYGLRYISLRYFNAAGADINGKIGEDHNPESHLIPLILRVALGKSDCISIYGNDYKTNDGTCVRDYIHVTDLADAHVLAIKKLRSDNKSEVYNLGNGTGFSVKEVIDASREVTKIDIKSKVTDRRPGDPAILIASSEKIKSDLNWTPEFCDINKIIETAWNWHKNYPRGYKE
ncbi:MAG: UDP-glucose 4-epimerase GalE [Clostridiales bacterium]